MAKRGGDAALKRAREKARQAKQEAKRDKRQARAAVDTTIPTGTADLLMDEFAQLSASYEASQISEEHFVAERHRIFVALGIAEEDD
jgi:hypothetical protein